MTIFPNHFCRILTLAATLSTSLLSVSGASVSGNDENKMSGLFDCVGRADGTYPDYQRACRLFYACARGRLHVFWCPNGTVFDPQRRHCDLPTKVRCRDPERSSDWKPDEDGRCHDLPDGSYTDYSSGCRQFFFCNGGHRTQLSCPPKSLYDWKTSSCRPSHQVKCEPMTCEGRRDGFHVDVTGGCKRYLLCEGEIKISDRVCPKGQIFNLRLLRCSPLKGVRCSNESLQCQGLPDGFYPDLHRDCRSFYHCYNGRSKSLTCPSDLVFSRRLLACVHPWKSGQCLKQMDAELCSGSRFSGVHPIYETDCNEFVVCHEGWPALTGACPAGKVLSPLTGQCQPRPLVTCAPVKDPDCESRSDGLYPDESTSCSSFYLCLNGRRALTSYCKGSTRFDQPTASCLPTPLVVCNSTSLLASSPFSYNCRGRFGIFPDFASACRSYRVCTGGDVEETLTCPEGSLFNLSSSQCVKENVVCRAPSVLATFRCLASDEGVFVEPGTGCRVWHECHQQRGHTFACSGGQAFDAAMRMCLPRQASTCGSGSSDWVEPVPRDETRNLCTQSVNGLYTDQRKGCSSTFHICASNKTFALACPDNTTFRPESRRCHPQPCHPPQEFSCTDRSDGMYPDQTSLCSRYFVCESGRTTLVYCSRGERFNGVSMVCEAAERVPCGQARPTFECPQGQTGFFADFRSGCRQFHACFRAIHKTYSCPSVLLFNPKTRNCDLPEKVECRPPASPTTTSVLPTECEDCEGQLQSLQTGPPHVHGVPSRFVFRCSDKPDGFYADFARHCHVFYRCIRGQKFSHYCKPGLLFNPKIGICDFEANVQCLASDPVTQ